MPTNSFSLLSFSMLLHSSVFGGCGNAKATSVPKEPNKEFTCSFLSCWYCWPKRTILSRNTSPLEFDARYCSRMRPKQSKPPLRARLSNALRLTSFRLTRSAKSYMSLYGPLVLRSLTMAAAAAEPIPLMADKPNLISPLSLTPNST